MGITIGAASKNALGGVYGNSALKFSEMMVIPGGKNIRHDT